MSRSKHESLAYSLLLAGMATLPAFATDTALPAFLRIAGTFGTDAARIALTMSFFMTGFALGPVVVGPLSDHFGRRPVLLIGCGVFVIAGLGCTTAGSINALFIWCFIQGVGASAGRVLSMAIICDLFEGAEAKARLAYVNLIVNVAPMVAPMLGALILSFAGWRSIYGILTVAGCLLAAFSVHIYVESAPVRAPGNFSVRALAASYSKVLSHRVSMGYSFVGALSFGCLFAFISGSPSLLMGVFGLSSSQYTLAFGGSALAVMVGAGISGRLSEHGSRLLSAGLLGMAISTLVMSGLAFLECSSLSAVFPALLVCCVSCGLVLPNAAHGAIAPLPDATGTASAVFSCLQMIGGALTSGLLGMISHVAPQLTLSLVMTVCACLAAAIHIAQTKTCPSHKEG